jgi:sigma-B regulation protein RsbU (phosphoserine phosphatase)
LSALLAAFTFVRINEYEIAPIYVDVINNFLFGLLFAYFFLRYDIATVLIGSFVFKSLNSLYPMIFWGDPTVAWNGYAGFGIVGLLLLFAIIGLRKKIPENELDQYVPPYVERMQERDRLKRELEIARKVQLSFLPKRTPEVPQLNIATVCIPATEVGGDYYDFIPLDNHRLGVVIGDVSGKGISAAFHMTLTKGFLKSQAKDVVSPRDVLIRLNELFYENVDRGTFISMIYGIIDIKEKSFTFARAGHNPIIIRSSAFDNIDDLCPKGIALGLEKGPIFSSIIEEQKVGIRSGDIFIFYTDGVSEAMNKEKSEFGEHRLQHILRNHHHLLADDLVKIIQQRVNDFVGNTPQHDDLTMIIIKIL